MTLHRLVRQAGIVAAISTIAIGHTTLSAQTDPWLTRSQKLQMRPLHDTAGRVRLDYPNKDWLVVPGGSDAIVTLTEKNAEAAVFLDVVALKQPLAPAEVTDLFATIEVETIQQRDTRATGFVQRVLDSNGRRVVVIEYLRQGLLGPERVRQYSFPVNDKLYRLICSTPVARQAKYAPTFAHIAASLTVSP
jgi:hypothetical protein